MDLSVCETKALIEQKKLYWRTIELEKSADNNSIILRLFLHLLQFGRYKLILVLRSDTG